MTSSTGSRNRSSSRRCSRLPRRQSRGYSTYKKKNSFFCEKKELPPKKKPWNQDPGMWCPGSLVPGFPSKSSSPPFPVIYLPPFLLSFPPSAHYTVSNTGTQVSTDDVFKHNSKFSFGLSRSVVSLNIRSCSVSESRGSPKDILDAPWETMCLSVSVCLYL